MMPFTQHSASFCPAGGLNNLSPGAHTGPLPFTPFTYHLCWTLAGMHGQSTWSWVAQEQAELVALGPTAESDTQLKKALRARFLN